MKKSARIALFASGILALLLIAAVFAAAFLLNPAKLKTTAMERASDILGRKVAVEGVKVSLLPSPRMRLQDFSVAEASGFGDEPFLRLGSLDFSVRFWPLLRGKAEVTGVALSGLRVRVIRDRKGRFNFSDIADRLAAGPKAKPAEAEKAAGAPFAVLVETMRLSGGEVFFRDETLEPLRKGLTLRGIDLAVRDFSLEPPLMVSLAVRLKVADLSLEKLSCRDLSAAAYFKGSRLDLSEMRLSAWGGTLSGKVWADLGTVPPGWGADLVMEKVQAGEALASVTSLGDLLQGVAASRVSLTGSGFDLPSLQKTLKGEGSFRMDGGKLTGTSLLGGALAAASFLGVGSGSAETTFEKMSATFKVGGGKAVTDDLVIATEGNVLTAAGSVGLDRSLSLKARLALSPVLASRIGEKRLGSFPRDGEGRPHLPLKIGGTVVDPRFALDLGTAQKEAAREKIKEKLGEGLRRLFR